MEKITKAKTVGIALILVRNPVTKKYLAVN